MKFKIVFAFLFVSLVSVQAQSAGVKVTLENYSKSIASLNRRGVSFISLRQFSKILGAPVYFNPDNAKLEVKFNNGILKLTAQNEFAVYSSKTDNIPKVYQIPLAPVLVHNDIFIAVEFYESILSKASGRKIEFKKSSGEILGEILVDADDNKIPEPEKIAASENNASENNNVPEKNSVPEKKDVPDKNALTAKNDLSAKKDLSVKSDLSANSDLPGKKDISEDDPGIKRAVNSKFDIAGIKIDPKSNGTLIRLLCKKRITRYSASINNGVLFLNLLGVRVDDKNINSTEPKGLVKKAAARNVSTNSQIEFFLKDGYSTYEAFQDSPGNDLILTVHNKMLSKGGQTVKSDKWALHTVIIDAGHGGKDPGAIGVNGTKEKDVNLAIALKLGEMIQDNMPDVKVIYTRSTDKFVELYKRGKIANEKNGNLFISIHCNSTPAKPTSANGFEIYLLRPGRTKEAISIAERENGVIQYEDNPSHYQKLTDENFILVSMAHSAFMRYSERFSDLLNKQFTNNLSLTSNGIKQAGFYVLVGASMPSVLVETGFISNKNDEAYLAGKSGQKSIASSIFKTIQVFKEEYEKNLQMEASN